MTLKFDYLGQGEPILVTINGIFTVDDFTRLPDEFTSSREYPPNSDVVYDLSRMSFENISSEFFNSLVDIAEKYPQRSGARLAYVCPEDLQFGMMRIWSVLVGKIPVEVNIFRSMDDAMAWIKSN